MDTKNVIVHRDESMGILNRYMVRIRKEDAFVPIQDKSYNPLKINKISLNIYKDNVAC